jgi:hypothetical protein
VQALVAGGLLLARGAGAQAPAAPADFEGSVSLRLSARTPQGVTMQPVEYLVRAGKVRVNVAGPLGGMAMLAVPREQKLYVLMAAQNAYSEIPMAAATAAATAAAGAVPAEAAGDVKVVRTGRRETIAGYACEHVQVTAAAQTTDVCLSTALGRYVNPLESMRGTAAPAWQRAVGGEGFPLKVTLPDGTVALEVTRVEPKRLANDLFSVPLSYTRIELPRRR